MLHSNKSPQHTAPYVLTLKTPSLPALRALRACLQAWVLFRRCLAPCSISVPTWGPSLP